MTTKPNLDAFARRKAEFDAKQEKLSLTRKESMRIQREEDHTAALRDIARGLSYLPQQIDNSLRGVFFAVSLWGVILSCILILATGCTPDTPYLCYGIGDLIRVEAEIGAVE